MTMGAAWEDLTIGRRGDVAVIWFERPDRLNAFRLATFQMLHEALDQVSADDAVRAVVLIGRGRGFCAGEELEEMEGFSLACRLRIAAPEAYFYFPKARRSMLETNGTFHFLPRIVGVGAGGGMAPHSPENSGE